MGRWGLVLGVVWVWGCGPEVVTGSYYCGANANCPEDQVCDELTAICVNPTLAQPFACPDDTENNEPDDAMGTAVDLGETLCGQFSRTDDGCIPQPGDEDWVSIFHDQDCVGDEEIVVSASFPTGFAPLQIDVLSEDGAVLVTSESCSEGDRFTGDSIACVRFVPAVGSRYFMRITQSGIDNCEGRCEFNHYELAVLTEL